MSENDEPIFPRPLQDEEERKKILWETRSKLENEENIFNEKSSCSNCGFINFGQGYFCRNCGSRINLVNFEDLDVPIPVYGPPPMDFNNAETDEIHTTAYGPPPMAFENEKEVIQPIMPVYGPPPLLINNNSKKNNKLLTFAALLLFGLILFGAIAIVIIYFLFLR